MIFVTVGSQMPFERMIDIVDQWAGNNPDVKVVAQVGNSEKQYHNLESHKLLTPSEFDSYVEKCGLMVSHAGMGSILTSREYGKSIVTMPRLSRFKETRNDHQVDTANRLRDLDIVRTFESLEQLSSAINEIKSNILAPKPTSKFVTTEVALGLKQIIDEL